MNRGTHKRLPDSAFEPLKVTAWLQGGVIGAETGLPIDGVLWSLAMREQYGAQQITYPGGDHLDKQTGVSLNIRRVVPRFGGVPQDRLWFYAASFAQWPAEYAEGVDYWNKRVNVQRSDLIDFGGRRGSIDVSSSRFKGYHMPVFYRHACCIWWHVFGFRPEIERLLRCCTGVGKKLEMGYGHVLRWTVESADADYSVHDADGQPMRAIPTEKGGMLFGFRPSYWMRKNQSQCLVPRR